MCQLNGASIPNLLTYPRIAPPTLRSRAATVVLAHSLNDGWLINDFLGLILIPPPVGMALRGWTYPPPYGSSYNRYFDAFRSMLNLVSSMLLPLARCLASPTCDRVFRSIGSVHSTSKRTVIAVLWRTRLWFVSEQFSSNRSLLGHPTLPPQPVQSAQRPFIHLPIASTIAGCADHSYAPYLPSCHDARRRALSCSSSIRPPARSKRFPQARLLITGLRGRVLHLMGTVRPRKRRGRKWRSG